MAEDDFRIRNSNDFMNMLNSTTGLMTNLLLGVALLSLLVGGVGIMNIMLVSVTERTREIGLRMAVGARSSDILKQFLVESIILCLVGGIIGILTGHGAAFLVNYYLKWPIESSPGAVIAAVGVSGSVMNLFLFLLNGGCAGIGVMLSQFYGAEDLPTFRRGFFLAAAAGGVFTVLLMAAALFSLRPMLFLLRTQ
jgi:ABC-type antimicrobial peptide transport system permease subunit